MKCTDCGLDNYDWLAICGRCGKALPGGGGTIQQPAQEVSAGLVEPTEARESIRPADAERIQSKVAPLIAQWYETSQGWEEVAERMLELAGNCVKQGSFAEAATLLAEMACRLISSENPMRSREFGMPGYPNQAFLAQAGRLYAGIENARSKLNEYEGTVEAIANAQVKAEYWAHLGWALCVGGDRSKGMKNMGRARRAALALQPASYACDGLVKIAWILIDAGCQQEALGILGFDAEASTNMNSAVLEDRFGLIEQDSIQHRSIAAAWSGDLRQRIATARQQIAAAKTPVPWWVKFINERNKYELKAYIADKAFPDMLQEARKSIQTDAPFDTVLVLTTLATELCGQGR